MAEIEYEDSRKVVSAIIVDLAFTIINYLMSRHWELMNVDFIRRLYYAPQWAISTLTYSGVTTVRYYVFEHEHDRQWYPAILNKPINFMARCWTGTKDFFQRGNKTKSSQNK
jgi:hypothetical protein